MSLRILFVGIVCALSVVQLSAVTFSDEDCSAEVLPGFDSFELTWNEVPSAVSYRVYRTIDSETELMGETSELVYLVSDYALADVTVQVKWVSGDDLETDYCSIVIPKYELIYAEYFVDVDPGQGEGIEVPVEEGQSSSLEFSFDVGADVDEGMASVHFRYQDNRGLWTSEFVARIMGTQKLVGENYSLVYYSEAAGDWVPVESTVSQGDDVSFEFSSGAEGMQKPAFMLQSDEGHLSFPETVIYLSEKQAAVDGNATLAYRVEGNGEESSGVQNQVALLADVEVLVAPEVSEGIDYEVLLELLGSNGVNAWPARFSIDIDENLPPEADPGKDLVVYEYDGDNRKTVTLDGSASSDPESEVALYLWEWDGGSVEGEIVQIDLALGTTSIRLTVSDEFGVTASDDILVEVVDLDFDDDGLQDSFEMFIADADPDDGIDGIADVDGDGNFDGDEYTNLEEQTSLSDPTVVTVIAEEIVNVPELRISKNDDGSIRFAAMLESAGYYRFFTGQLGVDLSEWVVLEEGYYEDFEFDESFEVPSEPSFYALATETSAEGSAEIIDDEEEPIEFFQIKAQGLPLFLDADTEYDLKLSQVEGSVGQAKVNGEYEFTLIDLTNGEPVEFEYSIDPPFAVFENGVASSTMTIETSASLWNVGVVLVPDSVSVSSVRTSAAGGSGFQMTPELGPGEELLLGDRDRYRAADSTTWYYPSRTVVPIAGSFGEYPGHSDIHHGVDLSMGLNTLVYPVNRGMVVRVFDKGQSIIIDHGNNYLSKYLHVKPLVKLGAVVEVDDEIAKIAKIGTISIHLHLEIWKSNDLSYPSPRGPYKPMAGEDAINFLAENFTWKVDGGIASPWENSIKRGKRIDGIFFSKDKPKFGDTNPDSFYQKFPSEQSLGNPVYVIVNAVERRGRAKLGMREVSFSQIDAEPVQDDKIIKMLSGRELDTYKASEEMGLTSATKFKPIKPTDPKGWDREEWYRYWFKWDDSATERLSGPRRFVVEAIDNFDSGNSVEFVLGPEILNIPDTYYINNSEDELLLDVVTFNGPYPASQKQGKFEGAIKFEAYLGKGGTSVGGKVEMREAGSGGSWKNPDDLVLTADSSEADYQIEVKVSDLSVPVAELVFRAFLKEIPSIGHEVTIPVEVNGNELVLSGGEIDWQLVADSKTVNGQGDPIGLLNDPKGVLTFEDFQNGPSGLPLATSINTRFGSFITDALYINWASSGNTFDFNVRGTVYISSYLSEYGPTDNFVSAEGELELVNNSGGDRDILVTVESYLNNLFYSVGNPWPINTVSFFENNYNEKRPHAVATVSTPGGAFHRFDLTNKAPPTPETYRVSKLKNGETLRIDLSHVGMNYSTRTGTFFNIKVEMLDPVTVEE